MEYMFTTDLESCPSCKSVLNDSQGTLKVDGHSVWVDLNGHLVEALTEDTTLILSNREPVVECESCNFDLSNKVTATDPNE